MDYAALKTDMLRRLENELAADLYYHGVHHTLDVLAAAEYLAQAEGVTGDDLLLVQTAAVLHDAGLLNQYFKNEPAGAVIAAEVLPGYGYTPGQIAVIQQMILHTAVPQLPETHLERILCDADLDYLGRDDFYAIAHTLKRELEVYGIRMSLKDWYQLQVSFLGNHNYHTATAIALRQPRKDKYRAEILEMLAVQPMAVI